MSDKAFKQEEDPAQSQNQDRAVDEGREPVASKDGENSVEEHAKPKKDEKPRVNIGTLIFAICVFIAFVFCIAAISIGMMDSRTTDACISIWGYKPKCLGTWFVHMDWETFAPGGTVCNKGNSLMQGAQAFSVMCVIGGFLTVFVAILELARFAELAVVACIMSCINCVATLVTWSTMLAMYWSNLCGAGVYAHSYRIGNGLILFISAWCLQMVGNCILILDIYAGNSK